MPTDEFLIGRVEQAAEQSARKKRLKSYKVTTSKQTNSYKYRGRTQFGIDAKNIAENPVAFADVRVFFSDGSSEMVELDENGIFEFADVPEGKLSFEFVELYDAYVASHASNLYQLFKNEKGNKNVLFEILKLPSIEVDDILKFYDEHYSRPGNRLINSQPTENCGDEIRAYSQSSMEDKERLACFALMTRSGIENPDNGSYFSTTDDSEWKIIAVPSYGAVIKESPVDYVALSKHDYIHSPESRFTYQWFCINDPSCVIDHEAESIVVGPEGWRWKVKEGAWKYLGQHTLCCRIQFQYQNGKLGKPVYIEYQQAVKTAEEISSEAISAQKELPDPDNALLIVEKYIDLLRSSEKQDNTDTLNPDYMDGL